MVVLPFSKDWILSLAYMILFIQGGVLAAPRLEETIYILTDRKSVV